MVFLWMVPTDGILTDIKHVYNEGIAVEMSSAQATHG